MNDSADAPASLASSPNGDVRSRKIRAEYAYLSMLRRTRRSSDLAARITALRDAGWEMLAIADGIEVSRQWLYQVLAMYPEAAPPSDAPPILDRRQQSSQLVMRQDLADVPPPLCAPLSAMWAHVFRDKSAGTSAMSVLLDVTITLLSRRGVPYVRIAECGGVTHRAASQRLWRAAERDTLPRETWTSFLPPPVDALQPARTSEEAADPRRLYTVVQVLATSFPRFYSLRSPSDTSRLYGFDLEHIPGGMLAKANLSPDAVTTDESEWVRVISTALPEGSPLIAVPVQWLYTTSHPESFTRAHYDPVTDFYPPGLRPIDIDPSGGLDEVIAKPNVVFRKAEPVLWGDRAVSDDSERIRT